MDARREIDWSNLPAASTGTGKPRPRKANPELVRKIMQEKRETPYWELVCGHWTNRENRELYSVWRKEQNTDYCESCGQWIAKLEKPIMTLEEKYPERCPF